MSEFCFSISNKTHFSSLLFTDFIIFCSFILSNPLYFSYLLFFSPYILKLLSFLSPLFITTSLLLLLTLSTVFPSILADKVSLETSDSKVGFLLDTYYKVVDSLRNDEGLEFCLFEELETCLMVFNTIGFNLEEEEEEGLVEVVEAKLDGKSLQELDIGLGELKVVANTVEENPVEVTERKCGGESLECLLHETGTSEEVKHVRTKGTVSDKVGENQEESLVVGGGSREPVNRVTATNANSEVLGSSLGSFGSMRKEKEWKRTLACKLYEERQNVDDDEEEGMDLLWETYETDSSVKVKVENKEKKVKSKDKKQTKKKREVDYYEDEEEDDDMDGKFCCLQALKFSTGKMNLGMGRPNLAKISKALKGVGLFHQISRYGKKG